MFDIYKSFVIPIHGNFWRLFQNVIRVVTFGLPRPCIKALIYRWKLILIHNLYG